MIAGVHTILYSRRAEAVRAFLREVLKFACVDAGEGWLIFALPPGELGVHPTEGRGFHELYLMCTDIEATVESLTSRGVEFTEPITNQGWGLLTQLKLPDGETLGLYEPRHPTAIRMKAVRRKKKAVQAAPAKASKSKKARRPAR